MQKMLPMALNALPAIKAAMWLMAHHLLDHWLERYYLQPVKADDNNNNTNWYNSKIENEVIGSITNSFINGNLTWAKWWWRSPDVAPCAASRLYVYCHGTAGSMIYLTCSEFTYLLHFELWISIWSTFRCNQIKIHGSKFIFISSFFFNCKIWRKKSESKNEISTVFFKKSHKKIP